MYDISTILAELAVIIVLARIMGWLFTKVGQPAVVGEITAGILLGPSILGVELSNELFPIDTRPYLAVLAALGLVLFMFVVGLELDTVADQGQRAGRGIGLDRLDPAAVHPRVRALRDPPGRSPAG